MKVFPDYTQNHISPYNQKSKNIISRHKNNPIINKIKDVDTDRGSKPTNIVIKNKKNCVCSCFIIIILILAIIFSYYFIYLKSNIITNNRGQASPIFITKNPEKLSADMVKKDGDTRINIIITGMGGAGHKGGSLTDSIQILSIDPFNNTAGMISLPRDFYYYFKKDKFGRKLNTIYQVGEKNKKGDGGELIKKIAGEILDLTIHYYINIDFEGFKEIVDTLGGITVDVQKNLYDPYYPDSKLEGYDPLYIKSGKHIFDGALALKYARSRETTSDFDRSKRQQQIMLAIKEKAFSLGVLANPIKISELITIIGKHLQTDIQINEFQQLAKSYKDIDSAKIESIVINNSIDGPLTSTYRYGSYNLIPKLGLSNYSQIQNIAHQVIPDPRVINEKAKISIKYVETRHLEAQKIIDKLAAYGYTISDGGIISNDTFSQDTIQIMTKKAPFTVKYLTDRYSEFIRKQLTNNNSQDIIIILASD